MNSRLALVLVRNAVLHDARVLREAETLRQLGHRVLVAGVVSTDQPERQLRLGEVDVIRLSPVPRRLVRPAVARAGPDRGAKSEGPTSRRGPVSVRLRARAPSRLRRVLLTGAYYLAGIRRVLRSRPALVHANDYNTMWIGVAAKLLCGSRLIYDTHELWPDRNGRPEWRPWLVAIEALFLRLADAAITTSPGYANAIARRYRVPAPVVVRNIPARVFTAAPERNSNRPPLGVYLGGLMPGRGLEQAIDALALTSDLRLRFIGPGRVAYARSLAARAEARAVAGRVEFSPAVPPDDAVRAIAGADFGLMLIQPVCRSYELTLPNKLFEYAVAGLPMLASNLPVIGQLVNAEGIGEVVPPDDVARIAAAIARLLDERENTAMRERVAEFANRNRWSDEQQILARVYRGVAAGGEAVR